MDPQPRLGLAALSEIAFDGGNLTPFRAELTAQVLRGSAGALMDLSVIEQLEGNLDAGLNWQAQALKGCRLFRTFRRQNAPLKVLVFAAPIHMGGNTPVEFLLPGDRFDIITCYPRAGLPIELPEYDIAFCAAPADADDAEAFLDLVRDLTAGGPPVLNLPDHLIQPERDRLPEVFRNVPGLRCPETQRIARDELREILTNTWEDTALSDLGPYPFVVRPVGSHAGFGLAKLDDQAAFTSYLTTRDEQEFYVGEFIDYATPADGQFRKYRIVLVGGKPFPAHMAISQNWDVWYMNADMKSSTEKRAEEARFMEEFDSFSARHASAFSALADGLNLDYFGIDCAEDAAGNLVVFEADNALIVHNMDCRQTFPYKERHMQAIFDAFEALLMEHCVERSAKAHGPAPIRAALPVGRVYPA
ncbi:MAG: hypothetical protein AAFW64_07070 [Pseudomonadota bacterium]